MPVEQQTPLVSAIITTLNRPDIVVRAIETVLEQTYTNLELIIIVDGPDNATATRLSALSDPRARVVVLPQNVGLGEARNAGARESKGEWLAFLDDDDEWVPTKLSIQMQEVLRSGNQTNFSASRFEERTGAEIRLRPKFFPAAGEHWSESFYCNKILLLPSTFLVKTSLMLAFPFTKGLRRHEDADWLLRGQQAGLFHPHWVAEPLTIYHCETSKDRLSTHTEWRGRYQWYLDNPSLLTRKAVPFYIAMLCIPEARSSPTPVAACTFLVKEAMSRGKMSISAIGYLALSTLSSRNWRSKLRGRFPILQRRTSWRNNGLPKPL
ncbi:MAG: glycosyltransferase family 2 protein [Janthinobacterium lividum]